MSIALSVRNLSFSMLAGAKLVSLLEWMFPKYTLFHRSSCCPVLVSSFHCCQFVVALCGSDAVISCASCVKSLHGTPCSSSHLNMSTCLRP